MKWLWIIPAVFVAAALVLLIFGLMQPVKHSVTRSIHLKQKPDAVFAAIDRPDAGGGANIVKADAIADRNGQPASRYVVSWGRWRMIVTQLERTPPSRLVTAMARENGAVLGTWTYEISDDAGGCRISLTETGELKNPLFRAFARLRGLDANVTQTLRALANKFGEPAEL